MKTQIQRITLTAMFCALAFAMVALIRIPVFLFLSYEPKDVIIVISGFILGPSTAAIVSVITSLIEMFTISDTGIIGFIMNVISTCCLACTASFIYKKKRTIVGAGLGLFLGIIIMTAAMILWNYAITPIYMGYPREAVVELLLPVFLPFNLIKGFLNSAFVFLLYKPIVTALRKAELLPPSNSSKGKVNVPVIVLAVVIIITCILVILSMRGII